MVELSGFLGTNAGVAIVCANVVAFPSACNATPCTAVGCNANTTTNAAGEWSFSALAANTYDVRITSGASVRWRHYSDEIQASALQLGDDNDLSFGNALDTGMRWSKGDCSNHAFVIGLGDTSQQMHITDLAAIATDWGRCAGTHPELAIHSNTTPATDYLAIGNHDGTNADIDVVGGTTLRLLIAGAVQGHLDADGVCVITGNFYSINNTSVLNATTLGSGVVNSSLTNLGVLTTVTLSGDIILQDDVDAAFGTGSDILLRLSTASGHACGCCEDFVIALSDLCESLHITDAGAVGTDWNIAKTTDPNVYIHSNTTPATDYLRLGGHTGTVADIDVVGGTTLQFKIGGVLQGHLDADGVCVITGNFFAINNTSVLNATTLGGGVLASSLTSVGTIGTGVWEGTDVGIAHGGTGASLVDPDADRILFWDDSAGAFTFLTVGAGLTIACVTLTSTAPCEASQAQIEGECAGTLYIPPDLAKHMPGAAKAWVIISGPGALLSPDYNVACVGDTGTGDRDVNWTTAFSTCIFAGGNTLDDVSDSFITHGTRTTADVQVVIRTATSAADIGHSNVFFGDQ